MKAAYLSMLTEDDCLTFGETVFCLFRYELCAHSVLKLLTAPTLNQRGNMNAGNVTLVCVTVNAFCGTQLC